MDMYIYIGIYIHTLEITCHYSVVFQPFLNLPKEKYNFISWSNFK